MSRSQALFQASTVRRDGAERRLEDHPVTVIARATLDDVKNSRRPDFPGSMFFHPSTSKARADCQASVRWIFAFSVLMGY